MVMARRVGLLMFVVLAVAAEQVAAKADPAVEASLKGAGHLSKVNCWCSSSLAPRRRRRTRP